MVRKPKGEGPFFSEWYRVHGQGLAAPRGKGLVSQGEVPRAEMLSSIGLSWGEDPSALCT